MFVLCDTCNKHYEDMSDKETCPHRNDRERLVEEHIRNVRTARGLDPYARDTPYPR